MNIYQRVGCSQEDHLSNCSHFGYFGTYLSDHSIECEKETNGGRNDACICNPTARKKLAPRIHHLKTIYGVIEAKGK